MKDDPANQEKLGLLGQVYFEMGDLPSAGRFWLLTERSGPDADAARVAFEDRWGASLGERLKMIPLRGSPDAYPTVVRERIRHLREEAVAAGIDWPRRPLPRNDLEETTWDARLILAAIAVLGPGLWLLGVGAAIYLIVKWIA